MSLASRIKARKAAGETFDFEAAATKRDEDRARQAEAAVPAGEGEGAAALFVRKPGGSPAQRHRLRVLAGAGAGATVALGLRRPRSGDGEPLSQAEGEMRLLLINHQRSLKQIESREQKIALKREFLPEYEAWVDGVLSAATGEPDLVLTTILIWRLDVGDFFGALPLIDYVLRHKLDLPAHISRTPATFITEEIAEAALKAFDQGGEAAAAFPQGILSAIEDLVDHDDPDLRADMPDEVRAKLQKAIARAVLLGGDDERTRQEEALKRYLRALELDEKAGVKKDVEQLKRKLNKPAEPPAPADVAPPETPNPPPSNEGG